jgi:hypothetical protein
MIEFERGKMKLARAYNQTTITWLNLLDTHYITILAY